MKPTDLAFRAIMVSRLSVRNVGVQIAYSHRFRLNAGGCRLNFSRARPHYFILCFFSLSISSMCGVFRRSGGSIERVFPMGFGGRSALSSTCFGQRRGRRESEEMAKHCLKVLQVWGQAKEDSRAGAVASVLKLETARRSSEHAEQPLRRKASDKPKCLLVCM